MYTPATKTILWTYLGGLVMSDGTSVRSPAMSLAHEMRHVHFGFGTWIRNNVLTVDSEIYRLFTENGITHTDDMSGIIIRELYKYLWK